MIDFVSHNMAPLMFAGLILFMLYGYPAAFSLAAVGLFFGFIGIELGLIQPDFLGNIVFQLESVVRNDLLLAIPFFTLMGAILERCGLAEDLLEGFGQLFGGVRGGLSYAVILVGAVLGAITGTVAASVIAMGLISLPIMLKYGYNVRHATGVIAASGTITQLIPPSLVLVVLADQLGKSVGDMYKGAMGASVVQVLLFMAWVLLLSYLRPQDVPALPPEARTLAAGRLPSAASAAWCLRWRSSSSCWAPSSWGWPRRPKPAPWAWSAPSRWPGSTAPSPGRCSIRACRSTMRITAMVVFILIGARVFSLVFQGVGGKVWIETC